jgi:hypothetical protein
MGQVSSFDMVVRRQAEDGGIRSPNVKIVMIDARDGTHLPKKSFFSRAEPRYYAVSNAGDARNMALGKITSLRLQDLEHAVLLTAFYEVRCRPGNEIQAAVALYDPSAAPGEVFEQLLTRWLIELGEQGISHLVRGYLDDRAALSARIVARAIAETGLEVNVRLSLDAEQTLKTIVASRDHLRAIVSDYQDEEQDVDVRITLDVDETNRINAILQFHRDMEIQGLVLREVPKFIRRHVTMQAFCTDLGSTAIRQTLAEQLDSLLAPYGRKVGAIRLEAKPCSLKFFFQAQRDVTCRLHEYPTPVVISNKVQMILSDVRQYKTAKSPDLHAWLQQKLDRFIPEMLFGVQYIDVLVRFQTFEQEIKRVLSAEAAAIGYQIKQLITVPDLEPIKLRDPFTLDTSGTFETRLTNFHVKLQMVVTACIPILEEIESFLNRQQNVKQLMTEAIAGAARQYLHGIQPQRFYMHWDFAEGEERSVENELREAIEKQLKDRFHAEVIEIVLKVVDTDVIERLRKFQEKICRFQAEVESLNGNETLTFKGNFQVDGVNENGWHRFQLLTIGLDDIQQLLEEHIRAKLQSLRPETIQFRNPKDHKELEAVLSALAVRFVRDQFGLDIRVSSVHRERTLQESHATQNYLADRATALRLAQHQLEDKEAADTEINHAKVEQLRRLLAKRTIETDDTANDDYLEELDRKIAETREALAPVEIASSADVQRVLLPDSGEVSLREFAQIDGLVDDAGLGAHLLREGDGK